MESIKITRNNGANMELDLTALKKILRNPDYANYPIAVYSISGPFRSGKSFLQNILIHYILTFQEVDGRKQFITKKIEDFFEWRTGLNTCTEGIHMLSEPFILNKPGQNKIALFLMDTQGLFDNITSTKNATMMGILNFLLSSLQCFNVQGKIESYHLEHIYKFVNFSRKVEGEHPYYSPNQKNSLLFLLRDWENEEEIPFGLHMDIIIGSNLNRGQEHEMMKDYLNHVFGEIPGVFLPHPGHAVKKKPCSLSTLNEEFQEGIIELCDHLFLPENIVIKQINGKQVTCSEMFADIEWISPLLQKELEGNVSSLIERDINTQLNNLVMKCTKKYFSDLDNQCIAIENREKREDALNVLFSNTLDSFDKTPKRGGNLISEWRNELINLLKQYNVAIQECKKAEQKYFEALDELELWITQKSESSKSKSDFSNEATSLKLKELVEDLRKNVSDEIADQCCEYFEKHANAILTQTEEEVDQFFNKLRKQKILNICLGALLVIGGVTGVVAGAITQFVPLGTASIIPLSAGWKKLRYKPKSRFVRTRNTMSLPNNGIGLQKYESKNLTMSLNLRFGKVLYPLRSKVQIN